MKTMSLFIFLGMFVTFNISCSGDDSGVSFEKPVVTPEGAMSISLMQLNFLNSGSFEDFQDYEKVKDLVVVGQLKANYSFPENIFGKFINLETLTLQEHTTIPQSFSLQSTPPTSGGDGQETVRFPKLKKIILPEVTTIESRAFALLPNLTEIYCPKLLHVGQAAFGKCISLREVSFPELVSTKNMLFEGCTKLQKVDLPKLKCVEEMNFAYCTSLTDISLLQADTIRSSAFRNSSIGKISAPNLTYIAEYAFRESAITEVDFPKVKNVASLAFESCSQLVRINLPALVDFRYDVFVDCGKLTYISLASARRVVFPYVHNPFTLKLGYSGDIELTDATEQTEICTLYLGEKEYTQADLVNSVWKSHKWKAIHKYTNE